MRALTLVMVAFLAVACSKVKTIEIPDTNSYFPLEVGQSVIFSVDSIKYSPLLNNGKQTFSYEIKETIIDKALDGTGHEVYIFERVERKEGELPWKNPVIGTKTIRGNRAEVSIHNLKFMPLTFPIIPNLAWDGNAFIYSSLQDSTNTFYEDWRYTVTAIDVPKTVNEVEFDSTLTVKHIDDSTGLSYRFSSASYARNTGLISLDQYSLFVKDTSIIDSIPWPQRANAGFITHWRIKNH